MFSNAQNPALIGTWNIIQFNVGNNVEGEFMFEKKLKEASSVWDLFLMEDSKFKQISNMRGSGAMGTYEGTWKTSGNI
ncbi:MAG: hypothetical protein HQ521_11380 [Bacteroidetes bacterium]|nr:hypothetical protein [Bacteroidota bacterium]